MRDCKWSGRENEILKRDSILRVFLNLIENQDRLLRCALVYKIVSWIVSIRRQTVKRVQSGWGFYC